MEDIPLVQVIKTRKPHGQINIDLTIKCPYCKKKHIHSGGDNKMALLLGYRGSHCLNMKTRGYNLFI